MADESSPIKLRLPWRRWAKLALWTFVVGYIAVIVFFMLLQRKMLYVPTRLAPEAAEQAAAKAGFIPWRNKSGQFMGWRSPASSPPIGSILIAHGNAGWALNRAYLAAPIHAAAPLDVYILEYPGFGARAGTPDETSFLAAGDAALEALPTNRPIYLVSESIGAGVVTHLAQKYPSSVAGLVLFVPFDKLASVAQDHLPVLPAYFLLWDRFVPVEWLQDYRGPVKFIIAASDEVIPPALGQRLYDGYNGPKALEIVPGARHNETTDQTTEWWSDVLEFWQKNAAPAQPLARNK